MLRASAPLFLSLLLLASLAGCNTYREELLRTQHAFEMNQHERTLGLLRDLEADVPRLSTPEQAQYAYLRGMTDYRMNHRDDARHWLSIAKAYEDVQPGLLPTDWKGRMKEALDEMNGVVYDDGLTALATSRKPGEPSSK
ncbi:MAG: hypothetical protein KF819_36490 [Labilithrix sp.]|nr:hypothetical protein [Labilithrix sp.]